MISRVTDDYHRMAQCGCEADSEPASWAGFDRGSAEPMEISRAGPDHSSWAGAAARFVFVTKGNMAAPALQERTPTGVVRSQRTMSNPDITVEVRDGRIYGVRPNVHFGP